jgi:hypothetical protein
MMFSTHINERDYIIAKYVAIKASDKDCGQVQNLFSDTIGKDLGDDKKKRKKKKIQFHIPL